MKIFAAICVLSLLAVPATLAEVPEFQCTSQAGASATAQGDLAHPQGPELGPGGGVGQCQVVGRCEWDYECENACGRACGPLYGGACVSIVTVEDPWRLGTECDCFLLTPF